MSQYPTSHRESVPVINSRLTQTSQTDVDTVSAAISGSTEAFAQLVAKYRERVYRTIFRILRNAEDAEDATQDSFLNAFRHLHSFRLDAAFSTWITRIAINTALMHMRKKKRHINDSLDDMYGDDLAIGDLVQSDIPSPEDQMIRAERVARMYGAIRSLPPTLREITLDRLKTDTSVEELASRQGVSPAAAKSRLLRARRAIVATIAPTIPLHAVPTPHLRSGSPHQQVRS